MKNTEKRLNKSLVNSFKETNFSSLKTLAEDYGELTIDLFLSDGLLKDIPFIKTVVGVFKIGKSVHDAIFKRNLYIFMDSLKKHSLTQEQIKNHFIKSKNLKKELESVLSYCDRLIEAELSKYIPLLYISVVTDKISFDEFIKYLSILDKLLPGDIEFLVKYYATTQDINFIDDHFLRLTGIGLLQRTNGILKQFEFSSFKTIIKDDNHVTFTITNLGSAFLSAVDK